MCLYITKRNVHTGAQSSMYRLCLQSDGREPCSNLERREELIHVVPVSALSSPGLVPHDGVSTVSSSMPSTPISATSGYRYEDRAPSQSPNRKGKKKYRPYLELPGSSGRDSRRRAPLVSQPNPPSPLGVGQGRRAALPEGFRTNHTRAHSDSEFDNPFLSPRRAEAREEREERATEILDRGYAREVQRKEERQRKREQDQRGQQQPGNNEATLRQMERDRLTAQRLQEEEERMLDEQELRQQQRLNGRERLREETRRLREEQDRQHRQQEELGTPRTPDQDDVARRMRQRQEEEARRQEDRRRQEIAEREQVERLRRQISEGREREQLARQSEEHRRERQRHLTQKRQEEVRREEERNRQQLRARIEEEERRLAELEASIRAENHREAVRREDLRRAELRFEEADRRVRERERGPGRLDGPRFGERRNIAPAQGAFMDPFLEPSPYEHADFRRARGEEVLEKDRHDAQDWELDENLQLRLIPSLGRRRTISGRERGRETRYRDSFRNYPN